MWLMEFYCFEALVLVFGRVCVGGRLQACVMGYHAVIVVRVCDAGWVG